MGKFVLRRVTESLFVLILVTLVVFLIMQAMPGDPVSLYLGSNATAEQIEHYTREFGLDQPVMIQYFKWIAGIFRGELGRSISLAKDMSDILPERLIATLSVTIPALVLSLVFGVLLGIISARKRGKFLDSCIAALSNIGLSAPVFWVGVLLVYLLSLQLDLLPVQGYTPLSEDFWLGVKKLIMPVTVLSLGRMAGFTRQTRSAMLEVINQDYIRTARSKGLKERSVIYLHAFKNALIPIVTMLGMSVSALIGGTVLIEQMFVIPGIGSLLMTAILNKDFMVVQNVVLIIAIAVLSCNLIVDILYGYLDPRIRMS